jgi:hypothetical protein
MVKITKALVRKSLKVIAFSEAEGKYVSFVWGMLDGRDVFVASRKGVQAVRSEANQLEWPEKLDKKQKDKDKGWKLVALGACKLEGSVLKVTGVGDKPLKGSPTQIRNGARQYFKNQHKLGLLWTDVVRDLDVTVSEDEFLDAAVPDETIGLISDEDLDGAMVYAFNKYGDGPQIADEADNEATDVQHNADGWDGETIVGDDLPEAQVGDDTLEAKKEGPRPEPRLDPALSSQITEALEGIVTTLISVAQSIGLPLGGGHADIVAKLSGWLERILLALPPEKREAAAVNWLARLQLAINSSTQSMRDASVASPTKTQPSSPASEQEDKQQSDEEDGKIINGVDLNDLTTDELDADEVVRAVFEKALESLRKAAPEYDPSAATDANIRKMVDGVLARLKGVNTSDAISRMFETVKNAFQNREILFRYLGLPDVAPERAVVSTPIVPGRDAIPTWIATWRAAHGRAVDTVQKLKADAERALEMENRNWSVASLGGTWARVDDIFKQVDLDEVVQELQAVEEANEANLSITAQSAIATLRTSIEWLATNEIINLIETNPFTSDLKLREPLTNSLQQIVDKLEPMTRQPA